MKKSVITYALAASGLVAALPQAAHALNAIQVVESITAHGLVAPYELEKTHNYWQAQATAQDGSKVYVLVNDANGQLTAVSKNDLGTHYPDATQVVAHLRALGYAQILDVEFDDGFWEVKVRQHHKAPKQELLLHPVTLEVIKQSGAGHLSQATPFTATEVVDALRQAGYTRVTDVEFDDGFWEADATNPQNQRVELKLHPQTAAIVSEKLDD